MDKYKIFRKCSLFCMVGLLLWAATSSLAQDPNPEIRTLCDGQVELDWDARAGLPDTIYFDRETANGIVLDNDGGAPSSGPYGLKKGTNYQLYLDWGDRTETISFTTSGKACKRSAPRSKPPDITCPLLPPSIVISGYGQFTQCKQVGAGDVAIPGLIAQGVIDAVDVFGVVDTQIRVCFRHKGRLKFLDAATAPRVESDLAAENVKGMTCGAINRPGTVVLLQGGETVDDASDIPPVAVETDPIPSTVCQLTATGYVSLRGGPSVYYARIDAMPQGVRLLGMARTGDWFLVDYKGQRGWASGTYLAASPGCDAIGESTRVFLSPATESAPDEVEAPAEMMEPAEAETTMPGARPLSYCSLRAGDIINHRQGPGLEYEIIAEIPNATNLIGTERTRDWFKVEYDGETGWVHIDYVFRHGCG